MQILISNSILIDGNVLRGCASDEIISSEDACDKDAYCVSCINVNGGGGCNNIVYPYNRRRCHICKGDLNSNCASEFNKSKSSDICPVYVVNERCFIHRTGICCLFIFSTFRLKD